MGKFVSCMIKTQPLFVDDEELVSHVEFVESNLKREKGYETESWWSEENSESDYGVYVSEEREDVDIRPRGYNTESWTSFLEEDFGGSNVAKVIVGVAMGVQHMCRGKRS